MAQRWMQAKLQLARKHGVTISGCNRAMGGCLDDRPIGFVDQRVPGTPKKIERRPEPKTVRPMKWGGGRKAKRHAEKEVMGGREVIASSLIRIARA